MKMETSAFDDPEVNNYVVAYEMDRRLGWEAVPGRRHRGAGTGPPAPPVFDLIDGWRAINTSRVDREYPRTLDLRRAPRM